MTFDEKFKEEAEALFDARAPLEIGILGENDWCPMQDPTAIAIAFADRQRAVEMASSEGSRFPRFIVVRFIVP